MKLLSIPTLVLTCAALVFSTASADDKKKDKKHDDHDSDHQDHHDNGHHYGQSKSHSSDRHYTTSYGGEPRGYYGESGLYHDGVRDHASSGRYHDSNIIVTEHRNVSYHHDYPRHVVYYQDRSYGYNYYELQTILRRDGYYTGPLDGDWGPGSRGALIRYQRDHGWHDDGQINGQLIFNLGIGR